MNSKIFLIVAAVGVVVMPGYSASKPPAVAAAPRILVPKEFLGFGVCKLGTSCMTMDKRPFEPCLVSTKTCADKARQRETGAPRDENPLIKISR